MESLGLVPLTNDLVVESNIEGISINIRFDHSDEVSLVITQAWSYVGVVTATVELDSVGSVSLDVLE